MDSKKKSVWLVGHKDSVKRKDWLAVCVSREEADRILAEMPEASQIKEVHT